MKRSFFSYLCCSVALCLTSNPALADTSALESHSIQRDKTSGTTLTLQFTSEGRCMVGDFDIIGEELAHNPNATLLLSLEPLPGTKKSFDPIVQALPLPRIRSGYETTLQIPAMTDESSQAGLYICADSSNAHRCGEKEQADANKLYKFYKKPESKTAKTADKIYYFQYISLGANKLSYMNKNKLSDEEIANFRKQSTANVPWGTSPKDAERVSDYILKTQQAVSSKPLQMSGNKITINLPHIEKSKCP